jgi:vitamin B12 transporter
VTYQNTGYEEKEDLSANVGYNFNENHRLGFIYTTFAVDKAGSPSYLSQNDLTSYTDKPLHSADAIYTGQTSNEFLSWKARFFGGKDKDKEVGTFGIFETISDRKGAQAQLSADWDLVSLTGGVDWVDYEIESTATPLLSTYDNPAGFLLAKGRLLDERLILSAGGRYDSYEVEVKEGEGRKEKDSNFTPNVGLAYLLTDRFKLRANYGEAFIIPSAAQLAADYVSFIGPVRGNPNLKPEKSATLEGGVDYFGSGVFVTLSYFYTDFEDKIEGVFLSGGVSSWENLGEATISGIEGELNVDLGAINDWDFVLRPYVRFTYLTKYEDETTGENLKYTPDLTAATGIVFSTGMDLTATFNVAYISETTVDDFENWNFFVDPQPEVVTLDSATVASLTITKTLLSSDRYGKLSLKGDITNLFNADYDYVKGYPMPGRSYYLGLRYDI